MCGLNLVIIHLLGIDVMCGLFYQKLNCPKIEKE